MKFSRANADVYIPDRSTVPEDALASVTHLCVAAHQDDIEIMAHAGIADCLDFPGKKFGGVVVTNGAGSPRLGPYASYSDEKMQEARREEQRTAAKLGRYAIQLQLDYPSAEIKSATHADLASDLSYIFSHSKAEVVYLHNPADKHDTHIAVLLHCLKALRKLSPAQKPRRVLGCEVWRDLDWLSDADKVALDSGRHEPLSMELLKAFDSQIAGGKRYDLGTLGRRRANATFHTSHATDQSRGTTWAIDLTPTIQDSADRSSLETLVTSALKKFSDDVIRRLRLYTD